jgi:hypothetical protein
MDTCDTEKRVFGMSDISFTVSINNFVKYRYIRVFNCKYCTYGKLNTVIAGKCNVKVNQGQ